MTCATTGDLTRMLAIGGMGCSLSVGELVELFVTVTCNWITIGTVLAGLAVGCGAFGAHGVDGYFRSRYANEFYEKTISTPTGPEVVERIPLATKYLADFDTAARYQMYHALALILLGLAHPAGGCRRLDWAGRFFVLGIAGFSGGLYAYTLFHLRWVGMSIVPLGGTCFLAGWGLFAWGMWSQERNTRGN